MRELFLHRPRAGAPVRRRRRGARSLSNPIASDLDALRPSPLPSLLAAAARNAARGLSDLNLFEIGPAFQSGMPGAQTTNAAGIIIGAGVRDWTKSGHAADAFDAKARDARGAGSGDGRAHDRAGHGGRAGLVSSRPQRHHRAGTESSSRWFGELHPKILAAFDLKVPVAAFEIILDAIPEPKAKKAARRSRPRPSRRSSAISPLWWMPKWRQARSSGRPRAPTAR